MAAAARFGTVWCPHWPVVAAGIAGGGPVVVLHANRVVAHAGAAAEHGVRVGQRRREAQAACPEAQSPRPTRRGRPGLRARRAGRRRARAPPGGHRAGLLAFAARGPSRYFGGDEALAGGVAPPPPPRLRRPPPAVGGLRRRHRRRPVRRRGRRPARRAPRRSRGRAARRVGRVPRPAAGAPARRRRRARRPARRPAHPARPPPPRRRSPRSRRPTCWPASVSRGRSPTASPAAATTPAGHERSAAGLRVRARLRRARAPARPAGVRRPAPRRASSSPGWPPRAGVHPLGRHRRDRARRAQRAGVVPADGLASAAMVERVRWQLDAWVQPGASPPGSCCCAWSPRRCAATTASSSACGAAAPRPTSGRRAPSPAWPTMVGEQQVLVAEAARAAASRATTTAGCRPSPPTSPIRPTARRGCASATGRGRAACRPRRRPWCTPSRAGEVVDADGAPVRVTGRGVLSAAPATLARAAGPRRSTGWAGPWPLEERWWDGPRAAPRPLPAAHRIGPPAARRRRASAVVARRRVRVTTVPSRWMISRRSAPRSPPAARSTPASGTRSPSSSSSSIGWRTRSTSTPTGARHRLGDRRRRAWRRPPAPPLARDLGPTGRPHRRRRDAVGRRGARRSRRPACRSSPGPTSAGAEHVDVHPGAGTGTSTCATRCGPRPRPAPPEDESQDVQWFQWHRAVALAEPGLAGVLRALQPGTPAASGAQRGRRRHRHGVPALTAFALPTRAGARGVGGPPLDRRRGGRPPRRHRCRARRHDRRLDGPRRAAWRARLVDQLTSTRRGRRGWGAVRPLAEQRHPLGLQLWTFEVNEPAQRFYERHGFVLSSARRGPATRSVPPTCASNGAGASAVSGDRRSTIEVIFDAGMAKAMFAVLTEPLDERRRCSSRSPRRARRTSASPSRRRRSPRSSTRPSPLTAEAPATIRSARRGHAPRCLPPTCARQDGSRGARRTAAPAG